MIKYNISEGISRHSLDHLIQPVLSIDEFESKISDKRVIVVGFYCGDAEPARDLSYFIDRSSSPILDTEVSPAPTPDGYYVVWVEIQRDKEFPQVLLDILAEVDNLTDVDQWEFQCPGHKDPIPVNKEELKKNLILDQNEIIEFPDKDSDENSDEDNESAPELTDTEETPEETPEEELKEFWIHAMVDTVLLEGDNVSLLRFGDRYDFHISRDLPKKMDMLNLSESGRNLQKLLGPNYAVYPSGVSFVIETGNMLLSITPRPQ